MKHFCAVMSLIMMACTGMPENIKPVENFDIARYLGKWYEIARLDHSFERGLSRVSAEYSLRDDGGVKVLNRGYSEEKQEWKEAVGKAYFVNEPTQGYLKVSFFGPFYGSYVIFELDQINYHYALVCGPNTSYLWLLARTPQIDAQLQKELVTRAKELGFAADKLIWVDHPSSGSSGGQR